MPRIIDIIRRLFPNAHPNYLAAFDAGDALLQQFGITTPLRLAHFLAQTMHETAGGTILFEDLTYTSATRLLQVFGVGNHSAAVRPGEVATLLNNPQALAERVYGLGNPRKSAELGNTAPGDGFRFRGGGLLQTTGGGNYRRLGERIGIDLHGHPMLIADPANALLPALHEWDAGRLNEAADRNDIRAITRAINGGYNGLPERQALFERIWSIANDGAPLPAWQAADTDGDTGWLQQALNDLGASPPLALDGRYGPATVAAVRWFQSTVGVPADGVAGEVTRAALRQRLAATHASG